MSGAWGWQCPVDLTHHAAPEIFIGDNMESHLLIADAVPEIFISDIMELQFLVAHAVLVMVIRTPQGALISAAHLSMKPHQTVGKKTQILHSREIPPWLCIRK